MLYFDNSLGMWIGHSMEEAAEAYNRNHPAEALARRCRDRQANRKAVEDRRSTTATRKASTTSSIRRSNEVRRSIDSARRAGVSENRIMHSVSELDAWILGK